MSVTRLLGGGLLAAGVAVIWFASLPRADEPQRPPVLPVPPKKTSVEEYRKQFPIESLADRLGYEKDAVKELAKTTPLPKMTGASAKRLEQTESNFEAMSKWQTRARSLELLHSNEAQAFVERDGFGFSRMPTPSVRSLSLPPAPTIPFPKPTAALDPDREANQAVPAKTANTADTRRMPGLDLLDGLHLNGAGSFLNAAGFGHVKDREHVAGFRPHEFRAMPRIDPTVPDDAKEKWLITRLELVSLLRHAEPAVYAAKELPRMDDLKKAKTRPLSDFESKALASLRDGQDMVTEATTNSIRMMGSLRAAKQCLECHEVRRGDLLGAFSYDLQRDPPQ